MPRKNALRDCVNAVRTRLPHLTNLTREQIELALLHYESNVDETVEAFNRNRADEALNGWTRKNTNRKTAQSSNGVLRPSQRVSNIFQAFADGQTPTPSPVTETSPSKIISESIQTTDVIEQRRKSVAKSRNNSSSQPSEQSSSISNNKKLLTKSVKDLQRQTSTLANVELLFKTEIVSSIKRIDEIFKQLHDILKQREIELYLEIDHVKEQGLNVIFRRQQSAIELRQRIDRCDRLQSNELDQLRTDIKQFVANRRYELREELTSSHRFEYDRNLVESLKHFGHVMKIDRRSSVIESNHHFHDDQQNDLTIEADNVFEIDNLPTTTTNGSFHHRRTSRVNSQTNK